ncbi:MAG: 4Fe-4S dicluster domain-containing protein [Thermoguttaceae bacterium]
MKRIVADPRRCMACRACELACAVAHSTTEDLIEALFQQGAKPRIYIESAEGLAVPLQCRHCEEAPCVRVCPSGALWRPEPGGPVLVQQDKCIGCTFCVQVCPFGVIRVSRMAAATEQEAPRVIKCDLCAGRLAKGLQPACVASCPVGALSFEEVDENARRNRARAAAAAVADGRPPAPG